MNCILWNTNWHKSKQTIKFLSKIVSNQNDYTGSTIRYCKYSRRRIISALPVKVTQLCLWVYFDTRDLEMSGFLCFLHTAHSLKPLTQLKIRYYRLFLPLRQMAKVGTGTKFDDIFLTFYWMKQWIWHFYNFYSQKDNPWDHTIWLVAKN